MKPFLTLLALWFSVAFNPVCAQKSDPNLRQGMEALSRSEELIAAGRYDDAYGEFKNAQSFLNGGEPYKKRQTVEMKSIMEQSNRVCEKICADFLERKKYEDALNCSYRYLGMWSVKGRNRFDTENKSNDSVMVKLRTYDKELRSSLYMPEIYHARPVLKISFTDRRNDQYDFDQTELVFLDQKAARLYWRWYYALLNGNSALANTYHAEYIVKYNKNLIELYEAYPEITKGLISVYWLERYGSYAHTVRSSGAKVHYDNWGAFGKLCALDRLLAAKYAKFCGNTELYAEAISTFRPEEALELMGDSKYVGYHRENLKKWGYTDLEYQQERLKYDSWDAFYENMKLREQEREPLLRAERMEAQAAEAYRQEQEARRRMERSAEDQKIVDEYKPRVVNAMMANDYTQAEQLASTALSRMNGGDAYFYYVQAYAYYKNKLHMDVAYDEDMTAYNAAYRNEAQELVRKCDRSINLDSSTGNEAYFFRGIAHTKLRQCADAVSDFVKAMGSTDKAICHYNIGIAFGNDRQYQAAIEHMKQAHSLYADSEYKSRCLKRIKDYQEKLDSK